MNILDNLKHLRAVVAAQPDDVLNLDTWRCGTHFCIGGLAAVHPHFQAMGLTASASGAPKAPSLDLHWIEEALAHFFQAYPEADENATYDCIFDLAGSGTWDCDLYLAAAHDLSHKELALARLDRAIALWEAA